MKEGRDRIALMVRTLGLFDVLSHEHIQGEVAYEEKVGCVCLYGICSRIIS